MAEFEYLVTSEACEEAARNAAAWLAKQWKTTGLKDVDDLGVLYKLPAALALAGHTATANKVLNSLARKKRLSVGVFSPEPPGHSFDAHMRMYHHSVILYGAAALGRIDICSPNAILIMMANQLTCGGWGYGGIAGACPTAMMGMLFLEAGPIGVPIKAADFLVNLMENSQHIDSKMYVMFDQEKNEVIRSEEGYPWLENRSVLYCVDSQLERQHSYIPGIVAAFLSNCYALTENVKYLRVAKMMVDFDLKCVWTKSWPSKCKMAWGLANFVMYARLLPCADLPIEAHEFDAYVHHLKSVTKHCFLDKQKPCGSFGNYHFPVHDNTVHLPAPGVTHFTGPNEVRGVMEDMHFFEGSEVELTAEYTYELLFVSRALTTLE